MENIINEIKQKDLIFLFTFEQFFLFLWLWFSYFNFHFFNGFKSGINVVKKEIKNPFSSVFLLSSL